MEFVKINKDNLDLLEEFINKAGTSLKHFRYFSSREPKETIKNHIVTYVLYEGKSVAYGHLDKEKDKVWLGVCVVQEETGKGYGRNMMIKLLNNYKTEIYLSVDSDNEIAIDMYKKFGFKITNEDKNVLYMKREGPT